MGGGGEGGGGGGEERKKEGREMLVNLLASIISSVLCKTVIYTKYSTLPRVISVYIAPKVGIFPRGRRPREIFSTEGAIYAGIS